MKSATLERYINEITAELQASNSEKDRALFENSKIKSEKNKVITEKDKEIARHKKLVASLSKRDSRSTTS